MGGNLSPRGELRPISIPSLGGRSHWFYTLYIAGLDHKERSLFDPHASANGSDEVL